MLLAGGLLTFMFHVVMDDDPRGSRVDLAESFQHSGQQLKLEQIKTERAASRHSTEP